MKISFYLKLATVFWAFGSPELAYSSSLALKNYTGVECGETPVVQRHASCGVESYQELSTSNCPAIFETKSDQSCGIDSYITKESAACGVSSYKQKADKSCPGYIAADSYTESLPGQFSSCKSGYREGFITKRIKLANVKFKTCIRDEVIQKCRKPEFGIERYKSCAHSSHGVSKWKSCAIHIGYEKCRSSAHPVESYKSCQTHSTPNTCQVYFAPAELNGWISSTKSNLEFKVENLILWGAAVQKANGQSESLGCLIKRVVTDSGFAGDVVFDESVLRELMSHYKDVSSKDFKIEDFANECSLPLSNMPRNACLVDSSSALCAAWNGYENAISDLEDLQDDLNKLKSDIVTRANTNALQSVNTMDETIKTTLDEAKAFKRFVPGGGNFH